MKKLKLLFTSVGRRVELIKQFKAAAGEIGCQVELWGADASTCAPALFFCDKQVQTCKIKDEQYIPQLLTLCQQEAIDMLIPLIDTDLLLLAQHKADFEKINTHVMVSATDKVRICRDKAETAKYFHSIGLNSPSCVTDYRQYTDGFPAFIKPKDGSGSIYAYKVTNAEELALHARHVPDYIVQPFIKGTEYTVDVFCDFDGNPIYITPRLRLAVRGGEVIRTKIHLQEDIIREVKRLIDDYKPCGAITIQLIRQEEPAKNVYIEINPRFGGGAPLSMYAGANSAKALLLLLLGKKLMYQQGAAEDGATYCRFDQSIRV